MFCGKWCYSLTDVARVIEHSPCHILRIFNSIEIDVEGDVIGKIYEYFLGRFAMSEGQRGGEFFTPTSIVKLIVESLEPFHGLILVPARGVYCVTYS